MKYRFYQHDYRLYDTAFGSARIDFQDNLTNFLIHLGILPEYARPVAVSLYERMNPPYRYYYTPQRILACVQTYQTMRETGELESLGPIQELALWFQNAVYIPGSPNNAAFSGDFAAGVMSPWVDVVKLRDMIQHTAFKYHLTDDVPVQVEVLLDINMAAMAAPADVYDRVVRLERKDYDKTSDGEYSLRRYKYLSELAKRKVFRTPGFRKLEHLALKNILREIDQVSYSVL